jgi:hypothetical protein
VFAGPFVRLRDRWLDLAAIFSEGHVESLTAVHGWLISSTGLIATYDHSHFIVQTDAGLDKTMLRLLAWKRNWPCHFSHGRNGQVDLIAFTNLGAELIVRYGPTR